jgi:DNA primase
MIDQILLGLVESVLGKGDARSKGNYAYHCPFCNHKNKKLEVNLITNTKNKNPYACWTCGRKGTTLKSLFSALKVDTPKYEELNKILGTTYKQDKIKVDIQVELPTEFTPFINLKKTDIISRHALKYLLKDRGISFGDIIKANIGFCESGRYKNKVIIPSYSKEGKLDYFVARSFEEDPYQKMDAPVSDKNIIGFESMINFDLPIIIVEGPMDALSAKRNAIPLF